MEKHYEGFVIKDDGTIINKFGKKVGHQGNSGYIYLSFNGKQMLAHRLIWEVFNGEIPKGMEIDHINTIRNDNRLKNLRLVTIKENRNNPLTKAKYKNSNKGKITKKLIQYLQEKQKAVYQYKNKELVAVYESVNEAARQLNTQTQVIRRYCNGGYCNKGRWINCETYKGFKFSFEEMLQ